MRRTTRSAVCVLLGLAAAACAEPKAADPVVEALGRGVAHRECLLQTVELESILSAYQVTVALRRRAEEGAPCRCAEQLMSSRR